MTRILALILVALLLAGIVIQPAAAQGMQLVPVRFELRLHKQRMLREGERYNQALIAQGVELDHFQLEEYARDMPDLALVPQEDVYQSVTFLSFAPDGRRLFLVVDGLPMVYDLQDHQVTLIAMEAPPQGEPLPPSTRAWLHRALREPNAAGLQWAADGRWLALSDPSGLRLHGGEDANVLLVNLEEGVARPLMPLLVPGTRLDGPESPGRPLTAWFSEDAATLHYDVYRVSPSGEGMVQRWAHNLATGSHTQLGEVPAQGIPLDPARLPYGGGVLQAQPASKPFGRAGVILRREGQPDKSILLMDAPDASNPIRETALLGVSGHRVLVSTTQMHTHSLLRLADAQAVAANSGLEKVLAIARDPQGPALLMVPTPASLSQMVELGYPAHGAFSPQGDLLLRVDAGEDTPVLYLLPAGASRLMQVELEGWVYEMNEPDRASTPGVGVRWLADGRMALLDGRVARLYELKAAD